MKACPGATWVGWAGCVDQYSSNCDMYPDPWGSYYKPDSESGALGRTLRSRISNQLPDDARLLAR